MPVTNVEIQPYDIDFTEKTLLPSDQCFDDERRHFIQNLQIREMDGIEFVMENGNWLLMRPSGTEPLMRMYAETDDKK